MPLLLHFSKNQSNRHSSRLSSCWLFCLCWGGRSDTHLHYRKLHNWGHRIHTTLLRCRSILPCNCRGRSMNWIIWSWLSCNLNRRCHWRRFGRCSCSLCTGEMTHHRSIWPGRGNLSRKGLWWLGMSSTKRGAGMSGRSRCKPGKQKYWCQYHSRQQYSRTSE